jgi:hypothetical protein
VVVRDRDRQRVVVDLARDEVADDEVVALEDLVHRRRLVHLAGDRHVVVDVERVRIQTAVPADDVERVMRAHVDRAGEPGRAGAAMLQKDLDIATFDKRWLGRAVQIALAVRRVFEQLTELRQIAANRRDVRIRLDAVGADTVRTGQPPVRRRARQQDVVALACVECAEHGFDHRRAGFDVDALVADRVPVQRGGLPGPHVRDADVVVAEDEPAPGDDVGRLDVGFLEKFVEFQVPGEQRLVRHRRLVGQAPVARVDERGRDLAVIEQRRVGGEALLAHQLLVEQVAVLVAELGVSLRRNAAPPLVVRHAPIIAHCAARA